MDPIVNNIISNCWALLLVVWLLAAIFTKRTVYRESRAQRLRYMIPIMIGCYLLFRGYRLPYPFNVRIIPHIDAILVTAAALCICGVGLCFWARAVLGTQLERHSYPERRSRIDCSRSLPAGPPSDLHRITCNGHRNGHSTGAHRRDDRTHPHLRKLMDQIELRRRSHAQTIPRSIRRLSGTSEGNHPVRPLVPNNSFAT